MRVMGGFTLGPKADDWHGVNPTHTGTLYLTLPWAHTQTRAPSCRPQATKKPDLQEMPAGDPRAGFSPLGAARACLAWPEVGAQPRMPGWRESGRRGQHRARPAWGQVLCNPGMDHVSVCLWLIHGLYKILKKINLSPSFKRCHWTFLWSLNFFSLFFFVPW